MPILSQRARTRLAALVQSLITALALFGAPTPVSALSYLVMFQEDTAEACRAHNSWAEAHACVGQAADICIKTNHIPEAKGLIPSDCAGRELRFWEDQLDIAYKELERKSTRLDRWRKFVTDSKIAPQTVVPKMRSQWYALRKVTCHYDWATREIGLPWSTVWQPSIRKCDLPMTAKHYFEIRARVEGRFDW